MPRVTRGPWKSLDTRDGIAIPFNGVYRVAGADYPMPEGVSAQFDNRPIVAECANQYDARLIAHAPLLLMLCQASLTYLLLEGHLDKDQLIFELTSALALLEDIHG